jgi:hypothetical protein
MAFSVGQRVTLLRIDDCMAMTHRYEFEIRNVQEPEKVRYEGRKLRLATVRQRGKRKGFFLDLGADDILLDGWDVPFKTDTECAGIMAGNACYNLVGDPSVIRHWIENQALIPVTDDAKAKIIVTRTERTTCDDEGQELLYPDIDTHHAVVSRLKDKSGVA